MDPNANLQEQRRIVADIIRTWDDCNADGTLTRGQQAHVAEQANRLAELVQALDQWITRGGVLPAAWNRAVRLTLAETLGLDDPTGQR